MAVKHFDNDVDPPKALQEEGGYQGEDDYEERPAKRARKAVEEIPPGFEKVKTTTRVRPAKQPKDAAVEQPFVESLPLDGDEAPSSPIETDAAAAAIMLEVDRIGPGSGPGWANRKYEGREVSYGRAGKFPYRDDVYDAVQAACGGGLYSFKGKGRDGKPINGTKILNGPPLPLPGDAEETSTDASASAAPPFGFRVDSPFGYPSGGGYPTGFGGGSYADDSDPYAPDENGIVPPRESVAQEHGLTGWIWVQALNGWKWFGPGPAPRSGPPAAPMSPAANLAFNPAAYDHALQAPVDPRVEKLEKVVEKLLDRLERPPVDVSAEAAARREEDRIRREDEWRRDQARRDEEWKRRDEEWKREERRLSAESAARQRDEERRREDAKAAAAAATEAARAQAEAMKESARLTAEAAKETAKLQAESNKSLFALMLQKTDSNAGVQQTLDLGLRIAEMAGGGRDGSDNVAGQIASAVQTAMPAVAGAVRDSVMAYKGFPAQGGPAYQPTQGALPAPEQQQQVPAQGIPDAQEVFAGLQLTGYLVQAWNLDQKPTLSLFKNGCMAYGLVPKYLDLAAQVSHPLASPEVVVAKFKQGVAALGNPQAFVNQIPLVERMATDPRGVAWFRTLQAALRAKPPASALPGPKAPAAPAGPTTYPTDVPASNPGPSAEVDPTRPEILQS